MTSPSHPGRPHESAAVTRRAPRRGTWVATLIVLAGVGAGVITVAYWIAQARWMHERDTQQAAREPAGAAPWDPIVADTQINQVKQVFEQVVENHEPAAALAKAAQRLVERYPRYALARTLLGQVWLYDGQLEKAYDQFKLSLDLDGQQPEVHLLAGTIAYQLNDAPLATYHYKVAADIQPSEPRYRLHLAQAYLRQQQIDEARDVLLEALRVDSSLHEAYVVLADVYAKQNRLTLALTQIQKAIEHTPVSDRPRYILYIRQKAKFLRRDNRPSDALLTLRSLSESELADPAIMQDVALCWSLLGQPQKAAAMFEDAMISDPANWQLVAGAVRWRISAGHDAVARRHLLRLREMNPRAADIAQLEAQLQLSRPKGMGEREAGGPGPPIGAVGSGQPSSVEPPKK